MATSADTTAVHKVFNTAELLEIIIAEVVLVAKWKLDFYNENLEPWHTLGELKRVNRAFATTIQSSPAIEPILLQSFPADDPDYSIHITSGLYWLFGRLGIDINYITDNDEGESVVRVMREILTGKYTDYDGRVVVREHLAAFEKFAERHGNPDAPWRRIKLRNCDDGRLLKFNRLEFVGVFAPREENGARGVPAGFTMIEQVDWTFEPDDTIGRFFDLYSEVMQRSPEEP